MKRPAQLNATFVKTVKRPGRYGDGRGGHGLSLLVKPTRSGRLSKTWSQRLRINGKAVNIGLGPYPVVTLAEARKAVLANRRVAFRGDDPRGGDVPTFQVAADQVILLRRGTWRSGGKSEEQWRASLEAYAFPVIGAKRVDRIRTADVLNVLSPMWNEKRVTAQRVRGRMSTVMKWCIGRGYRTDNPAGAAVAAALPQNGIPRQRMRALPHQEVAAALAKVHGARVSVATRLAFVFQVLTAARSSEVRKATWDEIDWMGQTWTVPASHMKAGRAHRVPLSTQALIVLREAKRLQGDTWLLFPGGRGGTLGRNASANLARNLRLGCVPHGFRSSFRDWAAESGVGREIAEAALAHVVQDPVEAAYRRTDLFELRRDVMERWGAYATAKLDLSSRCPATG